MNWDTESHVTEDTTRTPEIILGPPPPPEQIAKVRALLAGLEDGDLLLSMLGIEAA